MRKILVTGGTIFVSKFVAEYFSKKGEEVYVLNRNHHPQVSGVKLIEADRNHLGESLKTYDFDVIIDVSVYNKMDVANLLQGLAGFRDYIMISSSAVYPETLVQPFKEEQKIGINKYWGNYGTGKIEAEQYLTEHVPNAYILRPPYLYGPYNNVYREAFVFECALQKRKFYLPKEGQMGLQFFHVRDLCRMIEQILKKKPDNHIFNVGNKQSVSIKDWVKICYDIVGIPVEYVSVFDDIEQRNYFSFYNYEYSLDVTKQYELLEDTINLEDGLKESFDWYQHSKNEVRRKDYLEFIDQNLK